MCVKKSYHSYNHNRTLLIELSKKLAEEKFQLEQKSSQKIVRVHLCISFIWCLHASVHTSRSVPFYFVLKLVISTFEIIKS